MTAYQKFFEESVNNLSKQINKKMQDNNTLKSNFLEPHHRLVTVVNVHRYLFAWRYGGHFHHSEISAERQNNCSPLFSLKTDA